jgi:hypothetical protein
LLSSGLLHPVQLELIGMPETPSSCLFFDAHSLLGFLGVLFYFLFLASFLVFLLTFELLSLVLELLYLGLDLPLPFDLKGKHTVSFALETELEGLLLLATEDLYLSLFVQFFSFTIFSG